MLTNFVNEDCVSTEVRGSLAVIPEEFQTYGSNVSDISSYFSRPIKVASLTYLQTEFGPLYTRALTSAFIASTVTNFARCKGALGFRTSVCFRLQAIATPFQAGRVRMVFDPDADRGHHDRASSITPCSQIPGVELDLAETTTAIIKIPFIHPFNFWPIWKAETNQYRLGDFSVLAYTPVALGAGSVAPKLALWMWLEDFELIGATAYDIVAQSGKFQKKKDTSSAEANAIPGNISNVLAAGANFSTWMGRRIPTISTFSGMTSWALRFASNVAASHGWSKPIDSAPITKMMNTSNIYQNNCDGPDPSYNLGLTVDNAVAAYPGFAGTDVDEMSIDYLTSIFSAISSPSLSISNVSDDVIYSCALCPCAMWYNGTSKNSYQLIPEGRALWPTPIFALGDLFHQYRGGFKFRVKVSKTKFHSGRLILGFVPYNPVSSFNTFVPGDISDMQYKSVVWDLREGNVMEFECPFISPTAYLAIDEHYGTFFISVLEPLVGPETVSTVVPLVVEVAGMSDLEFAIPVTPGFTTAPLLTTFVAQSGAFEPVGVSTSNMDALHCVGERISSIKQLLLRSVFHSTLLTGEKAQVSDFLVYPTWAGDILTPTGLTNANRAHMVRFFSAYAYTRGGYAVDIIPVEDGVTISAVNAFNDSPVDCMPVISEQRTGIHVKMPFYSKRSRNLTSGVFYNAPNTVNMYAKGPPGTTAAVVYTRVADDFQLGYFMGFAPLCVPIPFNTPRAVALEAAIR